MSFCDTFKGSFNFSFQVGGGSSAHPLWIRPWDEPSVVFQHKHPKSYSNINYVFRHRYLKSYNNWRQAEAETRKAEDNVRAYIPRKKFYIQFCKLCILGHSTVLCFLVVKSFIVVNDGQLRIMLIILWTISFSSHKYV